MIPVLANYVNGQWVTPNAAESLEVSDHVHRSPVVIEIANLEGFTPARDTRVDFGFVHNLRAAAGLVVQFGR